MTLRALLALVCAAAVTAPAAAAGGSFSSSEPLLNRIWQGSVATAESMVSAPVDLDPRGCPAGPGPIVLDGLVRDRCPYVGDLAVTGKTLLVAGADPTAIRNMLFLFARLQEQDGFIPASPLVGVVPLVDYPAYWIEALSDYVMHTGDLGTLRALFPSVVRVLDVWYPGRPHAGGLLAKPDGDGDYAYVRRRGPVVAYYNAQQVWALRTGASLARLAGDGHAAVWSARADALAPLVRSAFWDAAAGAFLDATTGPVVHPQDGNAFAVLSGVATRAEGLSALAYLQRANWRDYGSTISDSAAWDDPAWGAGAGERVYPFMSYFELAARFRLGLDESAQDLIRREWGYMLVKTGPGTTWETIGPYGGGPADGHQSWAHGWSTGAAPALTEYVLGIRPAEPGYATWLLEPHTGSVDSAQGTVPTPHGDLSAGWRRTGDGLVVSVRTPTPGTVSLPFPASSARLDGRAAKVVRAGGRTLVRLPAGAHTLVARRAG